MKKGYIYKVTDALNNPHRVVIMEDEPSIPNKIKAIGLTHNSVGGKYVQNMPLKKEYFEEVDEHDCRYEFQWHNLGNGRITSMIKTGFDKPTELIEEPPVGKIKDEYLHILEENVIEYTDCPHAIKHYQPK